MRYAIVTETYAAPWLVPYTGARSNVVLGAYGLTAASLSAGYSGGADGTLQLWLGSAGAYRSVTAQTAGLAYQGVPFVNNLGQALTVEPTERASIRNTNSTLSVSNAFRVARNTTNYYVRSDGKTNMTYFLPASTQMIYVVWSTELGRYTTNHGVTSDNVFNLYGTANLNGNSLSGVGVLTAGAVNTTGTVTAGRFYTPPPPTSYDDFDQDPQEHYTFTLDEGDYTATLESYDEAEPLMVPPMLVYDGDYGYEVTRVLLTVHGVGYRFVR